MKIMELKTHEAMLAQYPLIRQLNSSLKKKDYDRMLHEMLRQGYRMVAVFDKKKCTGISGFWLGTKIYCDKYVELDNVVIDKNYRSKGVGKMLCDWIVAEAKKAGCKMAMLDAYVENNAAHRFYFREGYIIRGFHFLKKI